LKILIIKLGALGDVVMATPLIRCIQRAHAGADIQLLTAPAYAGVFAAWDGLEVRVEPRRGVTATLRTLRWIREARFDRVYDLQSNDRSALLCALSGIPVRIGNHPRFPYTHHPARAYRGETHIFERMNEVLAAAGIGPAPPLPEIPAGASDAARVTRWLDDHGLRGQAFAAMHAGASPHRADKRWPHFARLAEGLADAGLALVWLGAEPDIPLNRRLSAAHGIDATGAFSIAQLPLLARHARFALTNDSGPMHALAAAGIPVYAFFGPSDWRRNHALGQGQRVFASPDLAAISPDAVLERLRRDQLL
jgi:ADP-heptose:LPS heptosyltransferase